MPAPAINTASGSPGFLPTDPSSDRQSVDEDNTFLRPSRMGATSRRSDGVRSAYHLGGRNGTHLVKGVTGCWHFSGSLLLACGLWT